VSRFQFAEPLAVQTRQGGGWVIDVHGFDLSKVKRKWKRVSTAILRRKQGVCLSAKRLKFSRCLKKNSLFLERNGCLECQRLADIHWDSVKFGSDFEIQLKLGQIGIAL
jgi:hypothetical protein